MNTKYATDEQIAEVKNLVNSILTPEYLQQLNQLNQLTGIDFINGEKINRELFWRWSIDKMLEFNQDKIKFLGEDFRNDLLTQTKILEFIFDHYPTEWKFFNSEDKTKQTMFNLNLEMLLRQYHINVTVYDVYNSTDLNGLFEPYSIRNVEPKLLKLSKDFEKMLDELFKNTNPENVKNAVGLYNQFRNNTILHNFLF